MKLTQFIIIANFILFFTLCCSHNINNFKTCDTTAVENINCQTNWNSEEGIVRFRNSNYKTDFYQLVHNFQPQINPLYCGIATSVILLNSFRLPVQKVPSQKALEVPTPKVWGGDTIPFPIYTQWTLLNKETDKVKTRKLINLNNITPENTDDATQFDPGLTLYQLKLILEVYQTNVKIKYADLKIREGVQDFRENVKSTLSDSSTFLVANFYGRAIGATTGGHISPLAAYDENTDSVLILDVAGHKNPWYWVSICDLYKAMHTKDGNDFRGWLVVTD